MNTNNLKKYMSNKNAIIFLIIIAIIHAFYNSTLQLHRDETYYWLWSTKLQLCYFDHPPMVAYLIKIFTIFNDSEFFVRLPAVFCMTLSAWYVYLLTKEIFDEDIAWLTLITSAVLPATNMGYTIITPDAPLILFWSTSMYYSYKALFEDKWKYYILAGINIGFLMLSKYTSVLFLGFLLLFIIFKMPKKFLSVKPWIAILLAFIIFSPVIIWNYQNNWVSFSFQYNHGTSSQFRIRFDKFFEFIGGLFAIFTPIFFSILLYITFKYKEWFYDNKKFFIALSYLFPLTFFMYKSLFKKMELNWVAIAFIGGIILFSYAVKKYRLTKTYITGFILALLATIIMHFPPSFLPPNLNTHDRLFGYKEVVLHMQKYIQPGDALFSDVLYRASMFTYYTKGHPRAYIPTPSRPSSYTFWDKDIDFSKMKGIYYATKNRTKELKKVFKKVELLEVYTVKKKGFHDRVFYIYRVS